MNILSQQKPISSAIKLSLLTTLFVNSLAACTTETTTQVPTANTSPAVSSQQKSDASTASPSATMSKLTVVFASRKDSTDLQRKADAAAQLLTKELGIPVNAVVSDETAAVEALKTDRADVAFLSSRPALKAEQLTNAKMYLAEVRKDYSGGKTYNSVFVVRKDSPLQPQSSPQATLEQLKGKKIAFASRTSGSGFIFPVGELVSRNLVEGPDRLDQFFEKVTYGDGYSSALQAVLRGQADVGTVSEYALLPPWIKPEEAEQLRVLQTVSGVPAHGIAIDDDVPAVMREKIIAAFLKFNEPENNATFQSLYNSTSLVKVNHEEHLAPLRTALAKAGIKP